jgi:hypothetical protein
MIVLYTSALIQNKFEERKNQYLQSYNSLLRFFPKSDIHVIECFSKKPDFFDELSSSTFISNTHNESIRNKGVLELMAIQKFLENNNYTEDTLFFKLTGRYQLIDDHFLKIVLQNTGFDFYGKIVYDGTQIFTGCFCIKFRTLYDFIYRTDFDYLNSNMINIENAIYDYLISTNSNYFFVDKLNLIAPIFGTGNINTITI